MKKLPGFLQPYLPSYNILALDADKDNKLIISTILNDGGDEALKWLYKTYSKEEIKNVIKAPTRGIWYKWVLDYWIKIFKLNIPKRLYNKALFSL